MAKKKIVEEPKVKTEPVDEVLAGYVKRLHESTHDEPKPDDIVLYIANDAKTMANTQKGKVFRVINGYCYCYWEKKDGTFEAAVGSPSRLTRIVKLESTKTE